MYDAATGLAGLIDHTLLTPGASAESIERICREAVEYGFYAVCVRLEHTALAAGLLAGGPVKVAAVANFPDGGGELGEVLREVEQLIASGADEVDYVMDMAAAQAGEWHRVSTGIAAVTGRAHAAGVAVKVIIEACLFDDSGKVAACQAALAGEADLVKTSTGYSSGGATVADVKLLRAVAGEAMGVKASGGIRDAATALAMVEAGASRIGTSHGLAIIGA